MRYTIIGFVGTVLTSFLTITADSEVHTPSAGLDTAQLGVKPQWHRVPGNSGEHMLVQWSRDSRLMLTPNESYFPKLGLACVGEGIAPPMDSLNGKQSFGAITGWNSGESAAWGIWLKKSGAAKVRISMLSDQAIGKFRIRVESQTYEFKPSKVTKEKPVQFVEFAHNFQRSGQHVIHVENIEQPSKSYKLQWLEFSGIAVEGGGVIRTRWRPAAAHAKFSSTTLEANSRMWIVEMDAVPGELGFYAPITTPFGYYGPTWKADGNVNQSMNFSFWSFGRGKEEPPVEKLSHLLAIGSRDAKFSGFGHEGTGVKIRNFNALAGRQGQRQAFALRLEPGKPYDTYYSYFYATDEKQWKLYGVGRKLAGKRPIKHLIPGTFVEVPGPPKVQRSGPITRRMRYRGWMSSDGKQWHQLDQMSNGNIDKKTGLSHTRRGVSDGWFFLQTGGWASVKPKPGLVKLSKPADPLPEYMKADKVRDILTVSSAILVTGIDRKGDQLTIHFTVKNVSDNPVLTLYHGSQEGLTLENKWKHKLRLPEPVEGKNAVTTTIQSRDPIYLRMLLQNDHGQFFTHETTIAP